MKRSNVFIGIAATVGLIIIAGVVFLQQNKAQLEISNESAIHSPYAGQETWDIKALSQEGIEGLLTGAGTPFGGMAKPAELNGYPGPRHIFDAVEAGELEITSEQKSEIEALYEEMRSEAIEIGPEIINVEREIDDAFATGAMTEDMLQEKVLESATLYGQLRAVHLRYHLLTVKILTPQQIEQYNDLRGYTSGDPCENVPEGHDAEAWRLHNNCE